MININNLTDEKVNNYTNFMVDGDDCIEYETQIRCSNPGCREHKPLDKFHKNTKSEHGIQNQCKECKSKQYDSMKAVIYKLSLKAIEGYTVEYYGSSSSYEQRQRNHKSLLKHSKHGNKELQAEFNKVVNKIGISKALESLKFETVIVLTDDKKVELIELSSEGKDHLTKYLLELEKEVNNSRLEEVKENDLIKVVS